MKKSYKNPNWPTTNLIVNKSTQGQTLVQKIERLMNNKEPIPADKPLIYTERKDGVQPAYDPRTNRWEVAADATTKVSKSFQARREERHKKGGKDGETEGQNIDPNKPIDKEGTKIAGNKGSEPIQGK